MSLFKQEADRRREVREWLDPRAVKKALRAVYRDWHLCALPAAERGIPKGTLCDDCNEIIEATMKDLIAESRNERGKQ